MSLNSLQKALTDNYSNKIAFDQQFGVPICGIDEVGRGPLVGPVVSACVYIPFHNLNHTLWKEINDSKKISALKREKLFEPIKELCIFGIAEASPQEIDTLNIHHATLLAMKRAFHAMVSFRTRCGEISSNEFDSSSFSRCLDNMTALVDGKFAPKLPCSVQTMIKGDSLSLSIGAASILAKVTRDRMMADLAQEYPYYGWEKNSGYGTKAHMDGLQQHGLTPHHRLSFAPCSALKNMPYAKSLK